MQEYIKNILTSLAGSSKKVIEMPVAYKINDQGGMGESINEGGCFGFFGRADDYDDFDSYVAEYVRDNSSQIIVDPGHTQCFNREALGYLTWLFQDSPYAGLFISTPEEAIQDGYVKVDLDICNQTMILGLSHLRRIDHHGYCLWNQLDERIPSGIRAILVQILHPNSACTSRMLGSYDGDSTSTSYRYFDADALCSWVKGEPLDCEMYTEIGKYRLDFSGKYADCYSTSDEFLYDLDWQRLRSSKRITGLFYTGHVFTLNGEIPDLVDSVLQKICTLCSTDEQRATILGDYELQVAE